MSDVVDICLKHFVLSANISVWDVIAEGKSLMNNKGPSMLPCGTPEITDKQLDKLLLTETH